MWGLHMFKDLERALSGWHSSETAEPVKRCINRILANQQNDFTAQTCHFTNISLIHLVFRWFKFTLKPPNRITHDKL